MRFSEATRFLLIGSGKLFHDHQRGSGESNKLKKLKNQELDESSRSHPEKG